MNRTRLSCTSVDLLEDLLHALLELAPVFRARHHRVDGEFDEALVAQRLRHLAADDALRQSLDDGGLADARLADQDRVVLLAPGQHLDGGLDLAGPADDRVELALAGQLGEVARVFVEVRRVGGRLDAAFLGAAPDHLGDLLADGLRGETVAAQHVGGDALAFLREPDQEVLGADIGVAELARGRERPRQRILEARRDADLGRLVVGRAVAAAALLIELTAEVVAETP